MSLWESTIHITPKLWNREIRSNYSLYNLYSFIKESTKEILLKVSPLSHMIQFSSLYHLSTPPKKDFCLWGICPLQALYCFLSSEHSVILGILSPTACAFFAVWITGATVPKMFRRHLPQWPAGLSTQPWTAPHTQWSILELRGTLERATWTPLCYRWQTEAQRFSGCPGGLQWVSDRAGTHLPSQCVFLYSTTNPLSSGFKAIRPTFSKCHSLTQGVFHMC